MVGISSTFLLGECVEILPLSGDASCGNSLGLSERDLPMVMSVGDQNQSLLDNY